MPGPYLNPETTFPSVHHPFLVETQMFFITAFASDLGKVLHYTEKLQSWKVPKAQVSVRNDWNRHLC